MKLRQVCDRKLRLIYCDTGKPGRSYLISPADIEGLMQEKIHWITNLRGIACMMVVMIHSTSWYITHPHAITLLQWDIANLLNSASASACRCFYDLGLPLLGNAAPSRAISGGLACALRSIARYLCCISRCLPISTSSCR